MNNTTAAQIASEIYVAGHDDLQRDQDHDGNSTLTLGGHRFIIGDELDEDGSLWGWTWATQVADLDGEAHGWTQITEGAHHVSDEAGLRDEIARWEARAGADL